MIEWIYQTDRAVMEWVQSSLSSAWLDHIMIFITKLGDAGFIWILGGIRMLFRRLCWAADGVGLPPVGAEPPKRIRLGGTTIGNRKINLAFRRRSSDVND